MSRYYKSAGSVRRPLAALILAGGLAAASPALGSEIWVGVDQAKPMRLDRAASAIVIGNPAIADAYVQDGQLVFILGRQFGTTNVIALDDQGEEISNVLVTVNAGRTRQVTLHRGAERNSFACAPACEPVLKPGDSADAFERLSEQMGMKSSMASSAAAQSR